MEMKTHTWSQEPKKLKEDPGTKREELKVHLLFHTIEVIQ